MEKRKAVMQEIYDRYLGPNGDLGCEKLEDPIYDVSSDEESDDSVESKKEEIFDEVMEETDDEEEGITHDMKEGMKIVENVLSEKNRIQLREEIAENARNREKEIIMSSVGLIRKEDSAVILLDATEEKKRIDLEKEATYLPESEFEESSVLDEEGESGKSLF